MIIQRKRVRRLLNYLVGIKRGAVVVPGYHVSDSDALKLCKIGFTAKNEEGEKVLPSPRGPISRYNANGKWIPLKKVPKVTVYYQREWTRHQWHGRGTIEVTDIIDVPRLVYQKEFLAPMSVELTIVKNQQGEKYVVGPSFIVNDEPDPAFCRTVNLLLELFGQCVLLDSEHNAFLKAPVRSVNWDILPAGKTPWETVRSLLESKLRISKKCNCAAAEPRYNQILKFSPDNVTVGNGGFAGYLVYPFRSRGITILECESYGNATYVIDKNWEQISKMTKAQILKEGREIARLVHSEQWKDRLAKLFREYPSIDDDGRKVGNL